MENANKFSVPRQRIHILLREKPRKCSVEIGIKRGNVSFAFCRGSLGYTDYLCYHLPFLLVHHDILTEPVHEGGRRGGEGGGEGNADSESMRYVPVGETGSGCTADTSLANT